MLGAQPALAAAPEAYDPWPGLVQDIFNNRTMNDGNDVIAIEMPYRAEDAAIVPVTLRTKLSPGDSRRVVSITLVIDQNPAPMAAKFELGAGRKSVGNIDARARQQLHRRSCGGRTQRRQALYDQDLCQGVRRLLGACRQECRGSQQSARPDALPAIREIRRRSGQRRPRGADHDRPSQQFRPADGPGHAALYPAHSSSTNCICGRTTARC